MAVKRTHSEVEDENPFKSLEIGDNEDDSLPDTEEKWTLVEAKKPLSKKQRKRARLEAKLADSGQTSQHKKAKQPSILFSPTVRLSNWIKMRDLQGLILYLLSDDPSPQWVAVHGRAEIDRVVILQVPGLDADLFSGKVPLIKNDSKADDRTNEDVKSDSNTEEPVFDKNEIATESPDDYYPTKLDYTSLPGSLRPLADIFDYRWPIRASGEDKSQFLWSSSRSMLSSAIPKPKTSKRKDKAGHSALDTTHWVDKPTSVAQFVASREDLVNSEYTIHPSMCISISDHQSILERRKQTKTSPDDGWVDTHVEKFDLTLLDDVDENDTSKGRNVVAIDCEMCKTSDIDFELTRISVIDWNDKVILDELVKPPRPITDYLTQFSGITKEMLEPVSTTLEDIQQKLLQILTDRTIVIGHSLNSDFNALKITHPYVIDTSIIFPHPRGPPLRSSLKYLTQRYLNREIQSKTGSSGHDSIEDARAVLDLVKQKCAKGLEWGLAGMSDEPIYKRIGRTESKIGTPQPDKSMPKMTTAHINCADFRNNYGVYADLSITCETDAEVVEGIQTALSVDRGTTVPHGTNFIWAEFHTLEDVRGWRHNDLKFPGSRNDIGKTIEKVPQTSNPTAQQLTEAVDETVERISDVYALLPKGTVFIVYSGAADRREWLRLQHQHQQFKREYQTKKWDELSIRWTDVEEQALRKAYKEARDGGLGFITIKKSE
jgi:RNA exonuclease 1